MITIQEIADLAGVSRRTVDRVLNNRGTVKEETRDKIEKIMKEHDFHPNIAAKGLAVKKKKFKIAFCTVVGDICPIQEEYRKGAREKAEELKEFGVTIEFLTFDRDRPLPEKELKAILDSFDCDALATVPLHIPDVESVMKKAEAMGIPTVFFNLDDPSCQRMCYVGSDYVQAGRLAAGLVSLCTGDKGKVSVYSSRVLNSYSYEGRVGGFEDELGKNYPHMEIVEKVLLEDDENTYREALTKTLKNYPQLDAIYLVNPGNYSICRVASEVFKDRKVHIITNDLLPAQMDLLKKGIISATISQDAIHQGGRSLQILFDYLAYGIKPAKDMNYMELSVYIRQSTYGMAL